MKVDSSLDLPAQRAGWARHAPPAFAALTVAGWVVLACCVNPAQFADSIEQYNWAHSLELGYWKHPPLPTWLMALAICLMGASPATAYLLAALCLAGCAFCTWKIAQRLLPPGSSAPAIAVVLWSLHQGFSWRAQTYNHNTVLVLAIAAMVWATLVAVQSRRLLHWGIVGLLAGAALLSKYQAVVPILGVLFVLWRIGVLRGPQGQRRGVALALLVACAVFLPHLLWSLQHGLPSYQYFKQSAPVLGYSERIVRWLSFLTNQLRFHLPMLAALGVAVLFARARPAEPSTGAANSTLVTQWFWGLVGIPFLVLMAIVLLGGVKLQSFWGLQTMQFVPLLIAWQISRLPFRIRLKPLVFAALAIHLAGAFLYMRSISSPTAQRSLTSADRIFPARTMAARALADWQAATTCPLRYVVGPGFEAGLISVYSGAYPSVLEDGDFHKSPWIDRADLQRRGALIIGSALPGPGLSSPPQMHSMEVPARRRGAAGQTQQLYWSVTPPREPCPG
ncbi:glycosyltransferase family 39 protein [Variovorax terrae]|uniref:Glycosyltransferase family 39 protein n=1 Tax=Variovorax terrae TaxID=2923278 RepID=A0A9X2AP96_9BURK|nr:glycosyltransferase family 39 protein [Variovorax terrae]MCJ0763252.1 glycosyltransferase family 39 protein [Variovorax terrae]